MRFEIKDLQDCRKEIRVEIEFKELDSFIVESTKEIKENFSLDGFRKGKVPEEIINKTEKERILFLSIQKAIQAFYQKILKDNQIEAIGKPEVTILKMAWNNPVEFKIETWVLPEINLPDYRTIIAKIKRKKINVDEKEVENAIEWLRSARSKKIEKNSSCEIGDFVEVEYSSPDINGGKKIKEGFIIGQNHVLPEFESNIVGLAPGQQKNFSIKTKTDRTTDRNNQFKETIFSVKIEKVYSLIRPEANDQWAKSLGNFENMDQLKESLRNGIFAEKESIEKQRIQAEIISKISQETRFEIPKILIDLELDQTIRDLKDKIPQMLQISFDDYLSRAKISNEDDFKKSLLPSVKKKIKDSLIIKEIQKKEKIYALPQEIKEAADEILKRYQSVEEAERIIDPEDLYEYTKEKIEIKKTLEYLEKLIKD